MKRIKTFHGQIESKEVYSGRPFFKKPLLLLLPLFAFLLLGGCGAQKTSGQEASVQAQAVQSSTVVQSDPATAAPAAIRIAGLKGPTSMGMVKLMEDSANEAADNRYSFSLHGSADEVTPKLIQGELDMASLPANLAAVLYNNTGGALKVLAVNTLGVLYIVEKGTSISSFADLKGKTIYATGKGSTPEYTIRYLLTQNGIDPDKDVTLEFKSEPAEVVSLLASTEGGIAMLPQPYVTAAMSKVEGLRMAIDLTAAWEETGADSKLITGVLIARTDFINAHPDAVETFLKEYAASVDWVVANPKEAAALCEKFDIAKAQIAEKALPYCNITFLSGDAMKTALSGYLKILFDQNPKAVGGKLPDDGIYESSDK